jgi:hypothetical protein
VPKAYSVFAVALGVTAGSMFRRVIPAMATTFVSFVRVSAPWSSSMCPHYMTPISKLLANTTSNIEVPAGAWLASPPGTPDEVS